MEGRHEGLEPLDRADDLSSLGGEVEAVARGDRSMQQRLAREFSAQAVADRLLFRRRRGASADA